MKNKNQKSKQLESLRDLRNQLYYTSAVVVMLYVTLYIPTEPPSDIPNSTIIFYTLLVILAAISLTLCIRAIVKMKRQVDEEK